MRKVQRLAAGLLALSLSIACAQAEILTIDIDQASYEEINTVYQQLKQARIDKLKETYAASYTPEPKSDIMFRGIPWGTTRSEVEQQIGLPSQVFEYLAEKNLVISSETGIKTSYYGIQLAGYSATANINYVYPVVDGRMLHDKDLASMAYVEYVLWNVGDGNMIAEDLTQKLVQLYGDYQTHSKRRVWYDNANNEIEMRIYSNSVYIYYISRNSEQMINVAEKALDAELAEQEEILRLQNQNNYDGL